MRRREFLAGLAATASSTRLAADAASRQAEPAGARTSGRRYPRPVVDLHFHWYPQEFIDLLETEGGANGAIVRRSPGGELVVETPVYKRGFNGEVVVVPPSGGTGGGESTSRFGDKKKTDVAVMLEEMDRNGIDVEVVTQTNPHIIWAPPAFGATLARAINDGNSRLHQMHPKRFIGSITLPMQDVPLSLAELERAAALPGLRCVNVTENVREKNIGDEAFWPIYARCEQLGLPLFLKNVDTISERMIERGFSMMNIISNPVEATMAATSLMMSGTLDEFPRLEVYLPHGGGFFPFVNPRIAFAKENLAAASFARVKQPVEAYLRRFHYDLILHSPRLTRTLIDLVGVERVASGTDRPQAMAIRNPVAYVEAIPGITRREAEMILTENPARLLRL